MNHGRPAPFVSWRGLSRCYLRYRSIHGDKVEHLIQAVPQPACWRDAALPESISDAQLTQLLGAFKGCNSPRRACAIVRCLVDLGLRSSGSSGSASMTLIGKRGPSLLRPARPDALIFCLCRKPRARQSSTISATSDPKPLAGSCLCASKHLLVTPSAAVRFSAPCMALTSDSDGNHTRSPYTATLLGPTADQFRNTQLKEIARTCFAIEVAISTATYTRVDEATLSSVCLPAAGGRSMSMLSRGQYVYCRTTETWISPCAKRRGTSSPLPAMPMRVATKVP